MTAAPVSFGSYPSAAIASASARKPSTQPGRM